MGKIHITNLKLRTIIGTNDWERTTLQDVVINITLEYDASRAAQTDRLKDTLDYKTLTKTIIKAVESSRCYLLEKLCAQILDIVLAQPKVKAATVRVEKPFALRFADSVSVEFHKKRKS